MPPPPGPVGEKTHTEGGAGISESAECDVAAPFLPGTERAARGPARTYPGQFRHDSLFGGTGTSALTAWPCHVLAASPVAGIGAHSADATAAIAVPACFGRPATCHRRRGLGAGTRFEVHFCRVRCPTCRVPHQSSQVAATGIAASARCTGPAWPDPMPRQAKSASSTDTLGIWTGPVSTRRSRPPATLRGELAPVGLQAV